MAFGLLKGYYSVGHLHIFVFKEFTVFIVGRKIFEHFGKAGKHPTVAAGPKIFLAVYALMLGIHIFCVAVIESFFGVIHYAVAHAQILIELIKILSVTGDIVELCHHRHYHIEAVAPPPIIVGRSRHLIFHHLARTADTSVVRQYVI